MIHKVVKIIVATVNPGTGEGKWFKGAGKWSHYVMTWDWCNA